MKNIIIAGLIMSLTIACGSQKSTSEQSVDQRSSENRRPQKGGAPNFDQILAEMDTDQDGKLSIMEVQGPLKDDFLKIDANGDGFLTEAELENAPKPQRGQRPNKR